MTLKQKMYPHRIGYEIAKDMLMKRRWNGYSRMNKRFKRLRATSGIRRIVTKHWLIEIEPERPEITLYPHWSIEMVEKDGQMIRVVKYHISETEIITVDK